MSAMANLLLVLMHIFSGIVLLWGLWQLSTIAGAALLTALLVARDRLEDWAHQVRKRLQSMTDRP